MASGTLTPARQPAASQPGVNRNESFIEDRLHYTRRQVKMVDVASGLMILAAAVLAYLLAAAVLDHWLIEGGLGFWGRLGMMLGLVGGGGAYFWRRVLPPLAHRVNPVFAAQTIEQTKPSLKNSLINFLLLRGHRREVPTVIYQALEQRAATDLSQVRLEAAVDHRRVVRLGYVLTAAVIVFAIYTVLSPKNPWTSAARILWPWASIHAPTRVAIEDVLPGNTIAFYGDYVDVSARVSGLADGEAVNLIYSTADQQSVDQVVALTPVGEGSRYHGSLPPGNLGLQQDLYYRLSAGDCTTDLLRIEVQVAPAILVDKVDYHYPPYTGIRDRSVEGQGDLRAIEGTRVTIHASANQEIRQAEIDPDCAGLRGLTMNAQGKQATGEFTLRLNPDDPSRAEHESYQLRFNDRANRRPVRYRIEVLRDQPPEVKIISPQEEEIQVPLDSRVEIIVRAEDPDFGLRQVLLRAECQGRSLAVPPLLSKERPEKAVQGRFEAAYAFEPAKLGLKAGDRVSYWAEAHDNKEPDPNRPETGKQAIVVIKPEAAGPQAKADERPTPAKRSDNQPQGGPEQQPDPQAKPQPKPGDGQQPDNGQLNPKEKQEPGEKRDAGDRQGNDQKQDGTKSKDQKDQGESSRSPDGAGKSSAGSAADGQNQDQGDNAAPQKIDPQTNPGDAVKEILDDRDKSKQGDQKQTGEKGKQDPGNQADKSDANNKQQPGDESGKQPDQQPKNSDGQKPSAKPDAGKQDGADQQPGAAKDSPEQKPGKQDSDGNDQNGKSKDSGTKPKPGSQKPDTGKQQAGKPKPGGEQGGPQKPGGSEQQGGTQDKNSGQPQGGQDANSGQQPGKQDQPSGEKPGSQSAGGNEKPDSKPQPGGGQPGDQEVASNPQAKEKPSGGADNSGKQGGGGPEKPDKQQAGGGSEAPGNNPMGGEKPKDKQQPKPGASGESSAGQRPQEKQKPDKQDSGGGTSGKKEESSGAGKSGNKEESAGSEKKRPGSGEKDQTGANDSPRQQDPGRSGENSPQNEGTPSPQDDGPSRKLTKSENPGQNPGEKKDPGKSPANNPKDSDSQGDTAGDKRGAGEKGGGQRSPQSGAGTAGSNTAADEGGSTANQRGPGDTGDKAGDQVKSKDKTGSAKQEEGPGSGERRDREDGKLSGPKMPKPKDAPEGQSQGSENSDAGQAGKEMAKEPGTRGQGNPTTGGKHNTTADVAPPPESKPVGADDPNLEFAKKQVDLALEHLKDQLAKEKPGLLDRLGWTREEARQFLDSWRKMQAEAARQGPQNEKARKSFDEAIKSLGLRPHGTQIRGGGTARDPLQRMHDAGRFDPPSDWAEQVREYTEGVARGNRR